MSLLKSALFHIFFILFILSVLSKSHFFHQEVPSPSIEFDQPSPVTLKSKASSSAQKRNQDALPNTGARPLSAFTAPFQAKPVSATEEQKNPLHSPSLAAGVYSESEATTLPILLHGITIHYPVEAKEKGIEGKVIFNLILNPEGKVVTAEILSSPSPLLSEPALKAIKQFQFTPARLHEQAVAVQFRYTYRFVLE